MKTKIGHLQINVDPKNQAFYQDLFKFLEWQVLYQDEQILGCGRRKQLRVMVRAGLKESRQRLRWDRHEPFGDRN